MDIDFNAQVNRRCSESTKWGEYNPDVLPMWVADMDFRSPEPVIKALHDRVEHGFFGYAQHPEEIKESVIDWLSKRHGWVVSPDDLIFVPGVVAGFNLAAHAVTRPGDGVVVHTPTYGPFFNVAENVNLTTQAVELKRNSGGHYHVDYDAFEGCLSGRSRIFLLCNPQNPTGRVFHRDELEKIAEICLKHSITICSDEIHSDLIYSGNQHIPIASLSTEVAAQTITLIAPSKTFNIAGLNASVAIITNEGLRKKFQRARKGLLGTVNLLGQYATRAAYQYGEPWLNALLIYLESNRDYVYDFINNEIQGIRMSAPEGTYLAWLDCRDAGIEGNPSKFFELEAKVAVNDGNWFGKGGEGFVRLNFGCPRGMLEAALHQMKEALNQL